MHRGWLLFLGLTAFSPLALCAEGDVGKLLDQRLNSDNADQAKQEQIAIAKGKRLAVLTEGNAAIKDLDTLQAAIERWENQMKAILTSAEGQALASDPVSVEDFIHLQEAKRYPLSQVEGIHSQVQSVLAPLQTASDSSLYAPTEALVGEIRTASKDAKEALIEYDRLQAKWRALLQRTKGVQVSANAPTLAAAIDQVKEEQAKREFEAQQIARNQAKQDNQKRIAEAEASKQNEIARQEIERLNQEKELIRQQAEHQRMVKEASNEVLVRRFAPFLAKDVRSLKISNANRDPRENPEIDHYWVNTKEPEPLSYHALDQWGALSNVKMFSRIALVGQNHRPKGDFRNPTTDAEWREMQKRLDEFNRYAPIWVELGLLKN